MVGDREGEEDGKPRSNISNEIVKGFLGTTEINEKSEHALPGR
jgi:hypothetical protein